MMRNSIRIVFIFALLFCAGGKKWDSLIEDYFPKSCLAENAFGLKNTRTEGNTANPATVNQADVNKCLKHGERLSKSTRQSNEQCSLYSFPSIAMKLFFTSKQSPEAQTAIRNSKTTLFASKILQNKLTSCGQMSPNNFAAFLESREFQTYKTPIPPICIRSNLWRSLDGSCNNLQHPNWGAANMPLTRIAPVDYEDGIYTMRNAKSGNPLPSARDLSAKLFRETQSRNHLLTQVAVQWGQFVAHDMSLRAMEQTDIGGIQCCTTDGCSSLEESQSHSACAPILVSPDDYFYSHYGIRCLNYVRSATAMPIDGTLAPAQQINIVSSFIDGSPVYSSRIGVGAGLRSYINGKMKLSPNRFLSQVRDFDGVCDNSENGEFCPCFEAGDGRVNQTPLLAALQTILTREHNRIAENLHRVNPHWVDERLFQESRRILIAQIQHITYREWLPLCLGKEYVKRSQMTTAGLFSYDYDVNVNPGVINSFATGAFRFFHTLISGEFAMKPMETSAVDHFRLSDHYFKPGIIESYSNGLDAIFRGALSHSAMEADNGFNPEITNFLFKSINRTGIDLVAIDIQRGRDHGLPKYNVYRTICGMKKANCFDDLATEMSKDRIDSLKLLYESVDDIDLFVGGTLECSVYGSLLGPTFQCIVTEQFFRTRVGDRFFYDTADKPHSFTPDQLHEIKKSSMSRLICNNCDNIDTIQISAFESHSKNNEMCSCSDYHTLPSIDFNKWKEF